MTGDAPVILKYINVMNKKNIKLLLKYFAFFFLAAFLFINWADVSWIFNYRAISGIAFDFFGRGENIAKADQLVGNKAVEKEVCDSPSQIEIPKIEISAPLIFTDKENDVYGALDNGVVHFPDSAMPGEPGQTLILGHSAPLNWPKTKYDWIFSNLNKLQAGEEIFVYYNCQKITYNVQSKYFLDRGEDLPKPLTASDNVLILISCWPPGKDYKRIAVEAKAEI
ncbi:MAG: hypothetical protein UT22_C0001G0024 [Parcubacteria group bacterium GW2011_GWC2_39_11]|nr:MAG: hypothetical protein UT22_C0001G0024 [Parcubacteria group bacterium GW2011_GWC2_39_11]